MPDLAAAAAAYNASLIQQSASVVEELLALWAAVSAGAIDASWAKAKPQALATVVKGQLLGAGMAFAYHQRLLAAAGLKPQGPQIRPVGFAGSSSGPLDLSTVVDFAPIRTKQAIARGLPPQQALQSGFAQLSTVAESELQESARGVMDVAIGATVDRDGELLYRGYLRQPNPNACGRCLILANKFYRNELTVERDGKDVLGFDRHPGCRCTHVPIPVGNPLLNLPTADERFKDMSKAEQDKAFGKDGAEAIRAGSEAAQVINARAGMSKVGDSFTRQGTTRRSFSGRRLEANGQELVKRKGERYKSVGKRLSPAGCRKFSDGDPDTYQKLLKDNGYIL